MNLTHPVIPPHPIEEHIDTRFDFLSEEQRRYVVDCVRHEILGDKLSPAQSGPVIDFMAEIICELALHIDLEHEWQKIKDTPHAEIERKLKAEGIDAESGFKRLMKTLAKHGITAKTREQWEEQYAREYRQLMGED